MSSAVTPPSSRRPLRLTWWKRWLLLLMVPYLGALIMLAAFQRSLIYHPFAAKSLPANQAGFGTGRVHDLTARTEDNLDLRGWLVLAKGHVAGTDEQFSAELAKGRPVVLYFGGNAANRTYRMLEVQVLTEAAAQLGVAKMALASGASLHFIIERAVGECPIDSRAVKLAGLRLRYHVPQRSRRAKWVRSRLSGASRCVPSRKIFEPRKQD